METELSDNHVQMKDQENGSEDDRPETNDVDGSSDEEADDNQGGSEQEVEGKEEEKIRAESFFDVEAELSGDDASSDEEENEDDVLEDDENIEPLPDEEDQRDLNAKVFQ